MTKITMLTQQRVIKPEVIHPVVIEHNGALTLVDCGDPELAFTLTEQMRSEQLALENIRNIIITHHDLDHMGGLSQFRDMFPDVCVMAAGEQAGYIQGERRWLRLQREDKEYLALPPEKRAVSARVRAAQYLYFLPSQVNRLLRDGEPLPLCSGCRVIYTPWHMAGHISLYIPSEKAFIAGDALNTFDGELGLNSWVDLCPELTAQGLRSLAELDIQTVYGYHGGELQMKPGEFCEQILHLRDTVNVPLE